MLVLARIVVSYLVPMRPPSAALQRRNYAPDDLALAIPFRTYDRYVSANGNAAEFWIDSNAALTLSRSCSK